MTSSTLTSFQHEADDDEEFSHLHAIAGNKYRIVVWINYPYRVVYRNRSSCISFTSAVPTPASSIRIVRFGLACTSSSTLAGALQMKRCSQEALLECLAGKLRTIALYGEVPYIVSFKVEAMQCPKSQFARPASRRASRPTL
jgi:hypothetical protein